MKSGDYRLTVEWIRNGQSKSYADSISEFILTTEWIPYGKETFEPTEWIESVILTYAQGIIKFKTNEAESIGWHESYLEFIKNVGPGKWHLRVIEPFLD